MPKHFSRIIRTNHHSNKKKKLLPTFSFGCAAVLKLIRKGCQWLLKLTVQFDGESVFYVHAAGLCNPSYC